MRRHSILPSQRVLLSQLHFYKQVRRSPEGGQGHVRTGTQAYPPSRVGALAGRIPRCLAGPVFFLHETQAGLWLPVIGMVFTKQEAAAEGATKPDEPRPGVD